MNYSTLLTLLLTTPTDEDLSPPLLPLAPTLIPHVQALVRLLQDFRTQPVTPAATRDFELQLQQRLRQLGLDLCDWTFNHLEAEQPQDMPARLDSGGERYRRRDRSPNTIATLFGSLTLQRYLYEDREPGNPCLFPLEKRLGIVAAAATPALAERAAWWLAQRPQQGTLAVLAREHGVTWPVPTLRAVTAAFAASLEQHRQAAQVEQVLAWLEQATQSRGRHRPVLAAGRDGIHLPVRGSGYKEGATATLTVYDRRGRRLGTVYLGRMPEAGQGTLSQQLTALIEAVLRGWHGPLPRLGYVTDGGHHPAAYYRDTLARLSHPRTGERLQWQRIVDFYHASEYVYQLAEALWGDTAVARSWARRMQRRLKEKDGLKRLLQAATYAVSAVGLKGSRYREYLKAYRYLRRHGKWMKYGHYARVGLPLGSGVTEAACKVVFTQRLKQSGMRWEVSSGQVVVTLRVVLLSRVWDQTVVRMLDQQTFLWPGVEHLAPSERAEKAA
jgi:hypothetical protein